MEITGLRKSPTAPCSPPNARELHVRQETIPNLYQELDLLTVVQADAKLSKHANNTGDSVVDKRSKAVDFLHPGLLSIDRGGRHGANVRTRMVGRQVSKAILTISAAVCQSP